MGRQLDAVQQDTSSVMAASGMGAGDCWKRGSEYLI